MAHRRTFDALTPRGRAMRLRSLVQRALAQYDLSTGVHRVRLMTSHVNAVFRVDLADGTRRVLRVSHPTWRSDADLHTELAWLTALAETAPEIGAPLPLANRNGELVTFAQAGDVEPGQIETRRCVLFSWVGGRQLGEVVTLAHVRSLGALMARLHAQAATMVLAPGTFQRRFERIFPHGAVPLYADPQHISAFSSAQRTILTAALAQATSGLAALAANDNAWHPIHADLHHRNVLVQRGRLRPIDFEDALLGHPVQDIALTLFDLQAHTVVGQGSAAQLLDAFAEGYASVRPWPVHDVQTMTAMFLVRRIWTINWALRTQTGQAQADALQQICAALDALLTHGTDTPH